MSSALSWVEVSRLFLDHGTRVEVSRTAFWCRKRLDIGAEVSQSVLMPKCPVTISLPIMLGEIVIHLLLGDCVYVHVQNMVGPGEVDDELEGETADECSKYGKVTKCLIFEVTVVIVQTRIRSVERGICPIATRYVMLCYDVSNVI